jgi:hypothetical protein
VKTKVSDSLMAVNPQILVLLGGVLTAKLQEIDVA